MSSRAIAAELTTLGVATPSGGRWHPQTGTRALGRADMPGRLRSRAWIWLFSSMDTTTA